MKRVYFVFLLLCLGCSQAGPFITDIQFLDNKTIQVKKCAVEHNYLTGKISTENCSTERIIRKDIAENI